MLIWLDRVLKTLIFLSFISMALITAMSGLAAGAVEANPPAAAPVLPGISELLAIRQGEKVYRFQVEVVSSGPQMSRGLMFRTYLPGDAGMLFLFEAEHGKDYVPHMWMKNTLIPLDMLFIAKDGTIVKIVENTKPESLDDITAGVVVPAVLELAGGTAKRLGFKEGDKVESRYIK